MAPFCPSPKSGRAKAILRELVWCTSPQSRYAITLRLWTNYVSANLLDPVADGRYLSKPVADSTAVGCKRIEARSSSKVLMTHPEKRFRSSIPWHGPHRQRTLIHPHAASMIPRTGRSQPLFIVRAPYSCAAHLMRRAAPQMKVFISVSVPPQQKRWRLNARAKMSQDPGRSQYSRGANRPGFCSWRDAAIKFGSNQLTSMQAVIPCVDANLRTSLKKTLHVTL